MRQRILILCLASFAFALPTALSQKQHVVVEVKGLSCPYCAYGLEKQFKETPGVTDIKINVDLGLLSFTLSNSALNEKQINKLVKRAGFTAGEIKIIQQQGEMTDSANSGSPDNQRKLKE